MEMHAKQTSDFRSKIYAYFKKSGRQFPWRAKTVTPYEILVSEIMLQQTQTDRVTPKYQAFITAFPNIEKLAQAPQKSVLTLWSGLGYNRRALFLIRCAQVIVEKYQGQLPTDLLTLKSLPGVGPYTASAVAAFAFNYPTVVLETNIRTVFIHEFFADQTSIQDTLLIPLIEETLDTKNPRQWYWALMDYGAMLKKEFPNPNRRSAHYSKQSPFNGSNRQVRGMILKMLLKSPLSLEVLGESIPRDKAIAEKIITDLIREGFVKKTRGKLQLA